MDNLCVHRSRAVRDIFDEKFQQMFLPPHSCELNPIEKAWNIIKGEWRKTSYIIMDNDHRTDEKIKQAVSMLQRIADIQDFEKMKRVAECNHKTMALTLQGHLV